MMIDEALPLFAKNRDSDYLGAKLLAAAISLKCPKSQIIRAKSESYGFCCEFYWQESLSEEFLSFIEEEMHVILKKGEIKVSEMMRDNAAEFLSFHHQKRRAKEIKEWDVDLVRVIKVDTYIDVFEEEEGEDFDLKEALEHLKVFKLIELTSTAEKDSLGRDRVHIRIKGIRASHQMDLKEFSKKIKEANKYSHVHHTELFSLIKNKDEEFGLATHCLWYPEGLKLKTQLLDFLKNIFKKQGHKEVAFSWVMLKEPLEINCLASLSSFMYVFNETTENDVHELNLGLYSLGDTDSLCLVKGYERGSVEGVLSELITSLCHALHTLKLAPIAVIHDVFLEVKGSKPKPNALLFKKILKAVENPPVLLDLLDEGDYQASLSFFVKDSFERLWEVATIEIEDKKNPCYARMNLISIERWVALILDHSKSSMPQISLA